MIIAAGLSIAMGAAFGVLVLALKPVVKLAADVELDVSAPDAVYYLEGKQDNARARVAADTYKRFLAGNSVKVDEVDLNALRLTELESSGSFNKISDDGDFCAQGQNFCFRTPDHVDRFVPRASPANARRAGDG